ncbi:MAG: carboxypeptidase regulatory-like domain-containing protein [Acidobacteriaceae bacterium]
MNGGSIQGTITDQSGAIIPNAQVTISSPETGYKQALRTDASGLYTIGPLNPGPYVVTVTAPGFQQLKVTTVIKTGTATSGNFKLTVGATTQTIEVNAGAVQLNTDQSSVSGVISSQQFDTLPVNGRNLLDFAQLQPGVQLQAGGYADGGFDPTKAGYSAVSFSGISGRTTRILLDGQDVTDETVGTTIFNVSSGSISEMQVNRSTADPSTDITSQGSILASTKSGTNSFHGQLFYLFQDQRAGAATFEDTSSPFQRNQFGGSVGGPIMRNKLFFFGSVDRLKQDQSAPISMGPLFAAIQAAFPNVGSPDRDTYSAGRLDYNGPHSSHFFARVNYEANSFDTGDVYSTYANRDNASGLAGGADFSGGRFTHSFRGSYEKFHNLITDTTTGNTSIYNPIPGMEIINDAQGLDAGPNDNAPQQTLQSDKQLRYDGSWTKGSHNIRFGADLNRILGGGFAAFFGYGPLANINSTTLISGMDPSDPINSYTPYYMYISNNLGYASEKPGFGLPGGGQGDWRTGVYFADSWKITPHFTLTYGMRYQRDTGRTNSDVAPVPCSDVVSSGGYGAADPPCTGDAQLFDQWGAGLGDRVDQPNKNIGPTVGFAYNPPAFPKTVFRGGFGIYYDSNVFNNVQFDRSSRLLTGQFAVYTPVCYGGSDQLGPLTETSTGIPISTLCSESLAAGAAGWFQLQDDYRALNSPTAVNGGSAAYNLAIQDGAIAFAPKYKSPYSVNFNFGFQQQLATGVVLSVDYVQINTMRLGQTIDANHDGDSRFFDPAVAQDAIAATEAGFGCTDVDCVIQKGGTIDDFAGNGLDSGVAYLSGYPGSVFGAAAAFPGANPAVGVGTFQFPEGRAGYNGLQMNLREQKAHPFRGLAQSNFEVSYAYSRLVATAGNNGLFAGSDPFFTSPSYNNRNMNADIGPGGLDRTNIFSFGGAITFVHGPQIGMIGHFDSAEPTNLAMDDQGNGPGEIFRSDVNGDGQVGDLMPGTSPGAYMRQYGPNNLNNLIDSYNANDAGKLTPAGQVLVDQGLFTSSQMAELNAVTPTLAKADSHTFPNSPLRTLDADLTYPFHPRWFPERMSVQPTVTMYNVLNMGNFGGPADTILTEDDICTPYPACLSTLSATTGYVNTPYDTYAGGGGFGVKNGYRTSRKTGTFDQGAPRATEFSLKFNF